MLPGVCKIIPEQGVALVKARSKHTIKPRGWGSMAYPSGAGSRRVQFMLRDSDVGLLDRRVTRWGCASRADVVREGLRRVAAGFRNGWGLKYPFVLACATEAREGRKGRPPLVRWSQWIRPGDFENVSLLRGFLGLTTLADVVRFSIRAAEIAGASAPGKGQP
jgi:hypothetical protein